MLLAVMSVEVADGGGGPFKQPDKILPPCKPGQTRLFKCPSGVITSILIVLSDNTGNISPRTVIYLVLPDRTVNIEVFNPLGCLSGPVSHGL